ncbi:hypothetical protein MGYG_05407 [Nannizzia gypsea CBS 118893]|uniref:F-box domain-containing protein n=1 Tax=Arthroderma gypseum (strain ATCC MYA-4604 / CBS 118893) TaxID=535722 RepID=E4UVT4_ARTGP|nr:hypothetical protein MGYG_05407 [Nannizzia gypsea CBS 118893]EFR02411.1 hypothetical protein MGYG_05407 [Nannizzia gypsea CBS 118893]
MKSSLVHPPNPPAAGYEQTRSIGRQMSAIFPSLRSQTASPNAEASLSLFLELPVELWSLIMLHIRDRVDLRSFCLTCKWLCDAARPVLFEDIDITLPVSLDGGICMFSSLIARIEQLPLKHLKYTKYLSVISPDSRPSCRHQAGAKDDMTRRDEFTERSMKALTALAQAIPSNRLRSFRWDLGTCLPAEIFSCEHGLLSNQQKIESIYFSFGASDICYKGSNIVDYSLNISYFSDLRSLTWREPHRRTDFQFMKAFLQSPHHLTTFGLHLDSSAPRRINGIGDRDTHIINDLMLDVQKGGERQLLRYLETLSLGRLYFSLLEVDIVSALNLDRLRCLKLQECAGTSAFLKALSNSTQQLRLRSFQLMLNIRDQSLNVDLSHTLPGAITKFLMAFQSLEDLYFSITDTTLNNIDYRAIRNHYPTLRRLVLHGSTNGRYPWEENAEIPDGLFYSLLMGCPVKCISLRLRLRVPISKWKKLSPRPLCKLLHLRGEPFSQVLPRSIDEYTDKRYNLNEAYRRGNVACIMQKLRKLKDSTTQALLDFAKWAFSNDGLPELQVLVCGVLHNKKPLGQNLYFCRSKDGFKPLTQAEPYAWGLLQDSMDMLSVPYL